MKRSRLCNYFLKGEKGKIKTYIQNKGITAYHFEKILK